MAINIKTKQWGNSIGVVIPKDIVRDFSLSPGDEVSIEIKKKRNILQELFGSLDFGDDKEKIFNGVRKELEGNLV